MQRAKIRWAKKLMRARYFVLLTDKDSVIAMKGVNPDKFTDTLSVTAQQAALEDFRDKLNYLIERHQKVADKLLGSKDVQETPAIDHTNQTAPAEEG